MTDQIWALVPIKARTGVKSRLQDLLSKSERAGLVTAMASDVIDALKNAEGLTGIAIVTHDPEVIAWAEEIFLEVIDDSACQGLSDAVALASQALGDKGADAVLSILADTPRVTASEINALLHAWHQCEEPSLLLAPSRDGDGSNAMIFRPGTMAFHYGKGSAAAHLGEAHSRGLVTSTLDLEGLGHDIDTPGDLEDLVSKIERLPQGSKTARFLTKHEIAGRL